MVWKPWVVVHVSRRPWVVSRGYGKGRPLLAARGGGTAPRGPRPNLALASATWAEAEGESFSVPFTVSAHDQRLWIAADEDGIERELYIKGTNWVRYEQRCPAPNVQRPRTQLPIATRRRASRPTAAFTSCGSTPSTSTSASSLSMTSMRFDCLSAQRL